MIINKSIYMYVYKNEQCTYWRFIYNNYIYIICIVHYYIFKKDASFNVLQYYMHIKVLVFFL